MSNTINIEDIHVSDRLRFESGGDLSDLKASIKKYGQLQPLLVRNSEDSGKPYELVAGGRRLESIRQLHSGDEQIRNLDPGTIYVQVEGEDLDPIFALMMEYEENEQREGFTWQEKAQYVRKVHEEMSSRSEYWNVSMTGTFIGLSQSMTYKYLELVEDDEVFQDEKVQGATTFRTAQKQAKIVKNKKRREKTAKSREDLKEIVNRVQTEQTEIAESRLQYFLDRAHDGISHSDCREYVRSIPDGCIDFVHWDPPYGGDQDGGAFATHTKIDDSADYALGLMNEMLPEIWRILRDGHWLVIWYHPKHYGWLTESLKKHGFWVNPYPNTWYKTNRHADGHEITRYLTNVQEHFLFAGKWVDEEPILHNTNRANLFACDLPAQAERRHVMHKPWELLKEILDLISVPAEVGVDFSVGSGSIFEAAFWSNREVVGCELDKEYFDVAHEVLARMLSKNGKREFHFSQLQKGEDDG